MVRIRIRVDCPLGVLARPGGHLGYAGGLGAIGPGLPDAGRGLAPGHRLSNVELAEAFNVPLHEVVQRRLAFARDRSWHVARGVVG